MKWLKYDGYRQASSFSSCMEREQFSGFWLNGTHDICKLNNVSPQNVNGQKGLHTVSIMLAAARIMMQRVERIRLIHMDLFMQWQHLVTHEHMF